MRKGGSKCLSWRRISLVEQIAAVLRGNNLPNNVRHEQKGKNDVWWSVALFEAFWRVIAWIFSLAKRKNLLIFLFLNGDEAFIVNDPYGRCDVFSYARVGDSPVLKRNLFSTMTSMIDGSRYCRYSFPSVEWKVRSSLEGEIAISF